MKQMSAVSEQQIQELAGKYGVSEGAVKTLADAVESGHGSMAQFSHKELGGQGQWSRGGMTMVGDMFNDALKAKVNGLCSDLAGLLEKAPAKESGRDDSDVSLSIPQKRESSGGDWWGEDLGPTGSTGSQNDIRYAYFPKAGRLAVKIGEDLTIYDAGEHEINGVSQRQSGESSLSFTSQSGLVRVADLRVVSKNGKQQ